jgi:hypothetical protein
MTAIPGGAVDPKGTDILQPLQDILHGVDMLGNGDSTGGAFSSPAQSVAIIESTATALTKWWAGAIAALGGATAITTAATRFWDNLSGSGRAAIIGASGFVIAAALIALAVIIRSDLQARSAGAAALYAGRAAVAVKLLEVAGCDCAAKPSADGVGNAPTAGAAAGVSPAPTSDDLAAAVKVQVDPIATSVAALDSKVGTVGTDLASRLDSVNVAIGGLEQSQALVGLGAIAQSISTATPAGVTTAGGLSGTLTGVILAPNEDGSGRTVHLEITDSARTKHAILPRAVEALPGAGQ